MVELISRDDKKDIEEAIKRAEKNTSGEIRVHIKKHCNKDIFNEAIKVFQRLKMYKTKHRNGTLIYIGITSRNFAIIGDEGINKKVDIAFWDDVKIEMERLLSQGAFKEAIIQGVTLIGEKLKAHFPQDKKNTNELSNTISVE